MTTDRRTAAFTLLEVLIALAIFALAAVVLGASYINVLNAYSRVNEAQRLDEEVAFARRELLTEADRDELEQGGEYETRDGRRVAWRVEIEPTEIADLFDVTFTCEFDRTAEAEPEQVVQRFRLLRPSWSEEVERETLRREAAERIREFQRTLPGGAAP